MGSRVDFSLIPINGRGVAKNKSPRAEKMKILTKFWDTRGAVFHPPKKIVFSLTLIPPTCIMQSVKPPLKLAGVDFCQNPNFPALGRWDENHPRKVAVE